MTEYRVEKDSLGEVKVPADAYYAAQTQRAVDNFPITGMKPYPAFIWSMAVVKRCAAEVHKDLGLLDAKIADAIIQAGDEVIAGKHNDHFVVDPFQAGAGTSHNGVLWRLDELVDTLQHSADAFKAKAQEADDVVKSGRTHLQDAVPIRLGQEFGAYAVAIERNIEKIKFAAEGLRRMGIGGTANGTGLNAHPEYHSRMVKRIAELTGITVYESDDLFESMQSMQDATFFSSALRTTAQDFTRIANDIRLLSSGPTTGLAEITCPTVQPGSSIMPGKVNPVMAEMLNMAMFHVIGNDTTVMLGAQAGQLELNVMMPIISHNLNEMIHVMIGAVNAFTDKCIVGLIINKDKAEAWLAKNPILVTALNPIIGYNKGAEVAKKALAENRSIREIVVELGYMTAEEADKALNARAMTEGGVRK